MRSFKVDELWVQIYGSAEDTALAASAIARDILQTAIEQQGKAVAIFATGRSQIPFLEYLSDPLSSPTQQSLDWPRITGFHLDEYLGIAADHPASFRHYLRSHLRNKVPLGAWYDIEGDGLLPLEICRQYEQNLRRDRADLCCLGIGNNGHLAFNDPAVADFSDPDWVKIVRLDRQNRQQQLTSSPFPHLDAVPQYAFTLTLSAIRAARQSICLAYGEGKSTVVKQLLTGPVGTHCPASILRQMPQAKLLLDQAAAIGYASPRQGVSLQGEFL
ncbi:MAG: glucosamine-6-phosphate deaminase [Phormidesmis sp. RL_2_1]|nr:glucosamine-6-phosphate deaminase [Phormidesmis sp. RL_2_1]